MGGVQFVYLTAGALIICYVLAVGLIAIDRDPLTTEAFECGCCGARFRHGPAFLRHECDCERVR